MRLKGGLVIGLRVGLNAVVEETLVLAGSLVHEKTPVSFDEDQPRGTLIGE